MTRTSGLTGLVLIAVACSSPEEGSIPPPVVLVSDSLGIPYFGAVPSPDGTRLTWARTVAGRSAVFVSRADGSEPVQLSHGVWDGRPMWSPDGRWIAYAGESPDFDILVVSPDGGEPRLLTSGPANDTHAGWLPDGSGVVVYRTEGGVTRTIVAPLDGRPVRPLGPEIEGDMYVAVSPDGNRIAFDIHQGAEGTIWVQDRAGGEPRQLTTEGLENATTSFMWASDSRRVAYTSRRTGTRDIWIADVESGELRQLTTDVRDDWNAMWSPDGQWIAFLSDRGGQTDLWVVPSAGGGAERVTNDVTVESFPRWSTDGQSLLFQREQLDATLQLLPADGGPGRTLLEWPGYQIFDAHFSPDGNTVLFESRRSGDRDLWSIPLVGGEAVPVAPGMFGSFGLQYAPDGSQVVFLSTRAGTQDVWVMPTGGGEPRRLTEGPSLEADPRWSPDGTRIAYASNREATGADLWVMSAAGDDATRLTRSNLRPANVRWSPDGAWIYFTGVRPGGGRELYRIPATGGRVQPLGASRNIGGGGLSPDGSQFAYSTFEGGWAYVELIPSTGGTPRRLTQPKEGVFHAIGTWFPDGSALVVHDLDFEGNRDAFDLYKVTLPDGAWSRLTHTAWENELVPALTADSRQMLVITTSFSYQVLSASVGTLLSRTSPQ